MSAGHHSVWFVDDDIDANLICPICKEVVNNPMQCPNGHMCCSFCLIQCMEVKEECPVCRIDIHPNFVANNIFARDVVNNLNSKCYVAEEQGFLPDFERCGWTGPLHMREMHVDSCDRRVTTCFGIDEKPLRGLHSDDACYWRGPLELLSAHRLVCSSRRQVSCPNEKCLPSCPRRFNNRTNLRVHLVYYSKTMNEVFEKAKIAAREKKSLMAEGLAVTKDDKGLFCGQVDPHTSTKEGMGCQVGGGEWYAGSFKDGLRHYSGFLKQHLFEYIGNFFKGKMQGECKYFKNSETSKCGSGMFVDNVMHGKGRIWSSSPSSKFLYVGEFVDDQRHGKGTQTNSAGTKSFTGQFINGSICGEGVCTTISTQHTITGTFVGEFCVGKGVSRDAFGAVMYDGDYVNGFMQGEGIMNYANGEVYTGGFKKNKKNGQGVLVYADNSQYSGNFMNDKFHGEGVMTSAAGVVNDIEQYFKGVLREKKCVVKDEVRDIVDLVDDN